MVAMMMKWPPWPGAAESKKYRVSMLVEGLRGLSLDGDGDVGARRLAVEIRWSGGDKGSRFWLRRRCLVQRNFTAETAVADDGAWHWNEHFDNVCCLVSLLKDAKDKDKDKDKDKQQQHPSFQPWNVYFNVVDRAMQELKGKPIVVGKATLNLGEIISCMENISNSINIPVSCCTVCMAPEAALSVSLTFVEIQNSSDAAELVNNTSIPFSPMPGEALPEKEELSAIKAGLRKVKIFKGYVGVGRAKKACREEDGSDGRLSTRSEECEYGEFADSDSADECDDEVNENKDDFKLRNSFSYGTLAEVNCVERTLFLDCSENAVDDNWNCNDIKIVDSNSKVIEEPCSSESDHASVQSSMKSLFPWKKRKLGFRSPRSRGEPLLNKSYGEEGGDDIDFDRRQLCCSAEPLSTKMDNGATDGGYLDFGDDYFMIGSWEKKELTSRDGQMKLSAQVFFASIDQRSEKAAGESACTALVAVIADWLHQNINSMPVKSQFDELIRKGSLEWRNLCEVVEYRERFPDKHFDLDTVLHASRESRPLSVVAQKSFVGFFQPEGMEDSFEFLQEAMSFDTIWEEITRPDENAWDTNEPRIFIVSWNDHFFVLKLEKEAYYIIDTLGERLYEGCNQAYILKFDDETCVYQLPERNQDDEKNKIATQSATLETLDSSTEIIHAQIADGNHTESTTTKEGKDANLSETENIDGSHEKLLCKGKQSCKEFIKGFWAALPLRELHHDIKKGLIKRMGIHHRLQIDFHFTAHSSFTLMDDAGG